jgi:Lar family restriction alleviation protein
MKTKLLPCPFCGREASERFISILSLFDVYCVRCAIGFARKTKSAAIAAWNRRAKNA